MMVLSLPEPAHAADGNLAFGEKFQIRLASYSVDNADTDMAVFSSSGVGTAFSFADDLGGDDSVTIPRIDGFYRFNDRHRIEFSHFAFERDARKVITLELDIGEQSYSIGETLVSDINYELFKVGYAYSLYHSKSVEIGFTAGLNVTTYEFNVELADGSSGDSADATGPLPMFGLRVAYAINPRWSLHYLSEAFYIELGDEFKGSFQNNELTVQYRFPKHFIVGAGITRFSTDLDADDDDWEGKLADNHRGFLVFGSYRY